MSRTFRPNFPALNNYSRRCLLGATAYGGLISMLTGCGSLERGSPVPRTETTQATVLGLPNERFFPLASTDPLVERSNRARKRRSPTSGKAMWAV